MFDLGLGVKETIGLFFGVLIVFCIIANELLLSLDDDEDDFRMITIQEQRQARIGCLAGFHQLDYSNPDIYDIHDYAICHNCLKLFKVNNRGRWYETLTFIE